MRFDAIIFDIDGTIYSEAMMHLKFIFFGIRNIRFLRAFIHTRKILHNYAKQENNPSDMPKSSDEFKAMQAKLLAKIMRISPDIARAKIDKIFYRDLENKFYRVKIYKGFIAAITKFHMCNIKLAYLSDFPVTRKIELLKLPANYIAAHCTEEFGILKPHEKPFLEIAQKLGVAPERILFVGNSLAYDVAGANKAGMQSALFTHRFKLRRLRRILRKPESPQPNFIFTNFKQLEEFVLGSTQK